MSEIEAEIEDLRASFRAVLDDSADDIRRHVDEGAVRCEPLRKKAVELGWFSLLTPEEYGGLGLGRAVAAALYEELGRVTAPLQVICAMIATELVAAHGNDAQKATWLPRLAAGEGATLSAGGVTPQWDAVQIAAGAVTGHADNLLDGAGAGLLIVAAREANKPRWVLAGADSVALESIELVDRTRGLASARLEGAGVSVLNADAEVVAQEIITHASLAIACDSIGGAKAVLDLTIAYLKTREQFGKPIGSFQALKHRCAEHKVAIEAADALVRDAVDRWSNAAPAAALSAALAKALACDVYASVATDAVQLHGGIGFTWEHVCHLYLKRAKLNQTLFGGPAAHRDRAAQLLLAA